MKSDKKIFVTGGLGYIGSHTVTKLLQTGYEVTVLDNLSNSNIKVIERIKSLGGRDFDFIKGDILDKKLIDLTFEKSKFKSVIHFAGLKSVSESESNPALYYLNNLAGSIILVNAMIESGTENLIFSSSATVYGDSKEPKCDENTETNPLNIYGKTKLLVENFLKDVVQSDQKLRFGILRYFNPVGAHESGEIGEDPNGIPNNLLPFISQVAVGKFPQVQIWGNDYPTKDGTGMRDYIHVEDLALGHLAALENLQKNKESFTVNLGTGVPYSVLEVIHAFEKASGVKVPYTYSERRLGDVASNFADPSLAKELLGWQANLSLERMCKDAWNWQQKNPNGFN